ncbi:MAG TPA: biotin--[acetyl-CoA-carboxylase] ligase [Chitinophagaceae bacterium]|nr:biotin--[acetyl-CoA-carboxylase] ligase [Chitinophagaceae bacterium]HAN39517.1 biotin--[acetyl-CoA-carboxylase] ligase [Chitinophagaceae bacterium]
MLTALPAIGATFTTLTKVDSTNNYAMELIRKGLAQHGQVIFSTHQTAGKGQYQRTWFQTPGHNIAFSAILNTTGLPATQPFRLSVAAALASRQMIIANTQLPCMIKWPNDLFLNDKKAGGILIENIRKGYTWEWAVVGIGINVNENSFDEALTHATSLLQQTERSYHVEALAKQLAAELGYYFELIHTDAGWKEALQQYNQSLYLLDQQIQVKKDAVRLSGQLLGVDTNGALMLQQGMVTQHLNFGEASIML